MIIGPMHVCGEGLLVVNRSKVQQYLASWSSGIVSRHALVYRPFGVIGYFGLERSSDWGALLSVDHPHDSIDPHDQHASP